MIIHAGSFTVTGGSQDAVAAALVAARGQTLAEGGCHAYEFGFDVEDPTRVVFHELYEDRDAFDQHMHAGHTRTLFDVLGEHLAGRPAVRTYEAEPVRRDGDG